MHVVVGRAHERGVGVGQPPLLRRLAHGVAGHHVVAARLQCRDALGEDEGLTGKQPRHVEGLAVVVVVAYDVECPAAVEVVAGARLVAARRDGARRVVTVHNVGQKPSERPTPLPLPVREGSGLFCHDFMGHIHQQIGLISAQHFTPLPLREGLGGGSGHVRFSLPLLEHLVAYRPHQHRGVVAVAHHQVGQVALVPLVEEAGVVVLRLAPPPHVEALVHDDEPHRVAHVQQLGGGGIMRTAYGVHAHRLQLHQLAVQGVLMQGRSQAAQVVVLADAVQLAALAVEPEARRRVETEVAETGGRHDLVDHPAANFHLRANLIYMRGLARPQHRLGNGDDRLQSLRPADHPAPRVDEGVLDSALPHEGDLNAKTALAFDYR